MAYVTKGNYGYGDGSLGDITNPSGQINSYANVTAYTATTITIGTPSNGVYEQFTAGKEIMIHVSSTNGTSTEYAYLGRYVVAKIISVSGSVLTVDTDFTAVLPTTEFTKYYVQAITIAQFASLSLSTATITPPAFVVSNKYGGILLLKCSTKITFSGGGISLVDKGIPTASTAYRPLTYQESNGNADTDKYSGWENHITAGQFLLNAGDGAAMIWAKNFAQSGTDSRIGGTTAGAQFQRGTTGGSTIALIADDITGFDCSIISKRKGSGRGLGRCYIASKTKLRNDEGLYAYDAISDPYRLMRDLNIKGYGDGSLGDITNPTVPFNNYARVTSISSDGKTITYSNKTTSGMAQIGAGSLVMFHVSKHTDSTDMELLGKFRLAKILADDGSTLVLDTPVIKIFDADKISKYNCQIISIAQINNLTISSDYTYTTAWSDSTKIGGLCAIAVKGQCDLQGGKINVEAKGGGTAYARGGLGFIGNAQMADILPIGQGHGSVFLLTDNALTDANTRIGATYSGAEFGGSGSNGSSNIVNSGGGYSGGTAIYSSGSGGGYIGGGVGDVNGSLIAGSGAGPGNVGSSYSYSGGYGSNSNDSRSSVQGKQGAHLFIIINNLNIFNITSFSTGGGHVKNVNTAFSVNGTDGGASYGAGGGQDGGSGGSGAFMFIHINQIDEIDTTGVVAA